MSTEWCWTSSYCTLEEYESEHKVIDKIDEVANSKDLLNNLIGLVAFSFA